MPTTTSGGGRIRATGKAIVAVMIMAVLPLGASTPASASPGDNSLISYGPGGEEFTGYAFASDTSADGQRSVLYGQTSSASQNGFFHYFVRDGSTTVQLDSTYADSFTIGISDNGRWVAYINHNELIRTDLDTNQTSTLTPAAPSGSGEIDVSDDGLTVGFDTATAVLPGDTDGETDVYVWHGGASPSFELVSSETSAAGEQSRFDSLTPDGRHLLFTSSDHSLVPGDTTNTGYFGLYLRDLVADVTTIESRYNTTAGGGVLPRGVHTRGDLTDDGQTIVFAAEDEVINALPYLTGTVYVRDRGTGNAHILATSVNGNTVIMFHPSIDGAGNFVAAQTDWGQVIGAGQSYYPQVAVVEVATSTFQLVSHSYGDPAAQGNGQSTPAHISADGRHVVFNSQVSDLLATPYGAYANRVYRYEVQGGSDPDLDDDGIADAVDADGGNGSLPGGFADDVVNGTVTFVPAGFGVTITDAADPADGVRVQVTGTGTARVRVTVCGLSVTIRANTDVTFTCGSVIATVETGDVTVSLAGGLATVTIPSGTSAEVGTGAGGAFVVNVIDATGDGGTHVTLTVDGQTSTLGSGSTSFQAWDFVGFSSPIDNAPTINKIKGGRAVPVKWRLLSANGSPVTNLTTATLRFAAGACTGAGGPTVDVLQTGPGNSGLQNLGGGNYHMNWKTPSTATPCGELHLTVGDGVVHTARFQIT
jgi:hypothetical protein